MTTPVVIESVFLLLLFVALQSSHDEMLDIEREASGATALECYSNSSGEPSHAGCLCSICVCPALQHTHRGVQQLQHLGAGGASAAWAARDRLGPLQVGFKCAKEISINCGSARCQEGGSIV